ncbi:SDR family NAD(P)-dependent oxidoreductase [Nocardioides sp. LHG3406-4]|uniref:SDR family NAD(P)-dependent oxidoreductase n=1 Tax=Nocardioides sp. LHG3406-4 TaxID=2804575 RepID=UPI003CEA8858
MTDDRIAVVTGAASGIGKATGEHLTELGWRVVGVDLRESPFERSVTLDVTDREKYRAEVQAIELEMGPISLLASAAGYDLEMPIEDIDPDTWDRMFEVLLGGSINGCAAVLPHMKARGAGSIVIVSSELGIAGEELYAAYASAKGAVNGFVKALALEAIEYGVHVNAVAPGPTDTPLVDGSQWRDPEYLATLPLGRLVRPEDIAGTIALLADQDAYFVGEILSPNAGAVI